VRKGDSAIRQFRHGSAVGGYPSVMGGITYLLAARRVLLGIVSLLCFQASAAVNCRHVDTDTSSGARYVADEVQLREAATYAELSRATYGTHVLETARVTGQRISVFSGPVLSVRDPWLSGVKVPLAYWKGIGRLHRAAGRGGPGGGPGDASGGPDAGLRGHADQGAGVPGPGEQDEEMTGLRFGRLAATSVDVFARPRVGQTRALSRGRRAGRAGAAGDRGAGGGVKPDTER
jgi:hypothetical protein